MHGREKPEDFKLKYRKKMSYGLMEVYNYCQDVKSNYFDRNYGNTLLYDDNDIHIYIYTYNTACVDVV